MKRVLTIMAFLLLPLSVWAMTPISDSDLSNVTGQAGVNINVDLLMNVRLGTMAWGDSDGIAAGGWPLWTEADGVTPLSPSDDGGYVGITDFNLTNLRIKARDTNDGFGDYSALGGAGYTTAYLKPLTIDVAQDAGLYGGKTFVRIGLGSLKISMDALSMTVALSDYAGFQATPLLDEEMGSVNVGDMTVYISPSSYIDITTPNGAAEGGQGVKLAMNITLDEVTLGYVSWGDSDGLPAGNTGYEESPTGTTPTLIWMAGGAASQPGYIGLEDINFGIVKINGAVVINVITSMAGIYAHGSPGTPTTVCHIRFQGPLGYFNVDVAGPITANVKLDSAAALNSGTAGTLGDIYITGFGLDIAGGSWVDIWAH